MSETSYKYAPMYDESLAITEAIKLSLAGLFWAEGKPVKRIVDEWVDAGQATVYPTIVIMPIQHGRYEATTPHTLLETREPTYGQGHVLIQDAEFVADVDIKVVATDKVMRSMVVRALRERLRGGSLDGTYDLRLSCPEYYGGAVNLMVNLLSISHEDDPRDVGERSRTATLVVQCRLPVVRVEGVTTLLPRFVLEINVGEKPI